MNAEREEEATAETKWEEKEDASNATKEAINKEIALEEDHLQGQADHLDHILARVRQETEEDTEEIQGEAQESTEEVLVGQEVLARAQTREGEEAEAEVTAEEIDQSQGSEAIADTANQDHQAERDQSPEEKALHMTWVTEPTKTKALLLEIEWKTLNEYS